MKQIKFILILIIYVACNADQFYTSFQSGASSAFSHNCISLGYNESHFLTNLTIFSDFSNYSRNSYIDTINHKNDEWIYYKSFAVYKLDIGLNYNIYKYFSIIMLTGFEHIDSYERSFEERDYNINKDINDKNIENIGYIKLESILLNRINPSIKLNSNSYLDYSIGYKSFSFPWYFLTSFERNYIGLKNRKYSFSIGTKLCYNFIHNEEYIPLLPSTKELSFSDKFMIVIKNIDKYISFDLFIIGILIGMASALK